MRGWRILGLACALLLTSPLAMPLPVAAGTDHVTTCANSGVGSLPDVVAHATPNDTIVFDLECFDTNPIRLTSTITIGVNLTIDATSPLHDAMVDGGGAVTVFTVNSGVTVTLNGLIIQHGFGGGGGGGGIHNLGTLTVLGTVFRGNTAVGGSGVGGGAIRNDGTLTVANSTFGGNVFSSSGNSVSSGPGGGIANYGALTVTGSAFGGENPGSGNSATTGGGIYSNGVTLTVTNSTFALNSANVGGGIGIAAVTATVTNSTLSANHAITYYGSGIFNSDTLTVTNTIVAGNSAQQGGSEIYGPITSGGHNLVGTTSGSSGWIASDLTGLNPQLGPAMGDPTPTMALGSSSPAIGAGDASVCRLTGAGMVNGLDQRGLPRLPSTCDIGAYQMQGIRLVAGLSTVGGPAGVPATLTVTLGFGSALAPYTGTVHFTSSDPLAVLPADYTFTGKGSGKDNGTHDFTVTFRTAGTQTVTATDTLSSTLTGQSTAAITPVISAVSLPSGSMGGGNHVTIIGLGFGAAPANVAVTIGGSPAPVASVANTQLVVIAPAHAAGAVDVVVTVNGEATTVTGGYTFGTVSVLPGVQSPGGSGANPPTLPGRRPSVVPLGNPNPLPVPRP